MSPRLCALPTPLPMRLGVDADSSSLVERCRNSSRRPTFSLGTEGCLAARGLGPLFDVAATEAGMAGKVYRPALTLSRDGAKVLAEGEVDAGSAPDLDRLLPSVDSIHLSVHADLGGVTFLDTSGLAPFVEASRPQNDLGVPALFIDLCSPDVAPEDRPKRQLGGCASLAMTSSALRRPLASCC
jgi:anti-anti-sigma regulatory factor